MARLACQRKECRRGDQIHVGRFWQTTRLPQCALGSGLDQHL